MTTPTTGIALTVRNGGAMFEQVLDCISKLAPAPIEVAITDAFSTDSTWQVLQAWAEKQAFPVHASQVKGNIAVGRNAAIQNLTCDFVAITDADVDIPTNWLSALQPSRSNTGVVGGQNCGTSESYWDDCIDVIPMHGPSSLVVEVVGKNRFHSGFVTTTDHFAAVTQNCLIRKSVFDEVGGFDESLLTAEDGELNRRILAAGWEIEYKPDAVIRHHHRVSLSEIWRQHRNYAMGQAQANARNPAMRKRIHILPFVGLVSVVVLATLGFVFHPFLGLGILAIPPTIAILYGIKAAIARKRLALIPGVAFLFGIWQLAWAIYFPLTRMGRKAATHHAG